MTSDTQVLKDLSVIQDLKELQDIRDPTAIWVIQDLLA